MGQQPKRHEMERYWVCWIELIVAETENWKHCSKIIFKCVNSIVGLVNSVWIIYKQFMNSVFSLYSKIMWFYYSHAGNKKKLENATSLSATFSPIQTLSLTQYLKVYKKRKKKKKSRLQILLNEFIFLLAFLITKQKERKGWK